MGRRIFVVEDEVVVALEIQRALQKMGFVFAGMATHYEEAITGIESARPDLVLLDITLKQSKSGIEIAKTLKQRYSIPFVYLTSITDHDTMHEAVKTEPCGYLLKPFRREELYSALLLGLSKASPPAENDNSKIIKLPNQYFYDYEKQKLFCKDQEIKLGKKENKLLQILIEANGSYLPFQTIEQLIWEETVISDSALRTLLYRVNLKTSYALIETTPTKGCRIMISSSDSPKSAEHKTRHYDRV